MTCRCIAEKDDFSLLFGMKEAKLKLSFLEAVFFLDVMLKHLYLLTLKL